LLQIEEHKLAPTSPRSIIVSLIVYALAIAVVWWAIQGATTSSMLLETAADEQMQAYRTSRTPDAPNCTKGVCVSCSIQTMSAKSCSDEASGCLG